MTPTKTEQQQHDDWAANVGKAFTPFPDDEVVEFEAYRQHIAQLDWWDLANQDKVVARIGTAEGDHVEGATKSEVTALLTTYRKISMLKKEPGTFDRVRNVLAKHAKEKGTPEGDLGVHWLKQLKDARKDSQEVSKALGYTVERPDGTVETLKPKEITGWLVNGVISHGDESGRKSWESLGGWNSVPLMLNVLAMVNDEVAIFRAVDEVVGLVLDDPALRA